MNKIKKIIFIFVLLSLVLAPTYFAAAQTALPSLELSVEKRVFAYQTATSSAAVALDTAAILPTKEISLTVPSTALNYLAYFYGQKCEVRFGIKTHLLTKTESASSSLAADKNFFTTQSVEAFLSASNTPVQNLSQGLLITFRLSSAAPLANLMIAVWDSGQARWQTVNSIIEGASLSAWIKPGQKLVLLSSKQVFSEQTAKTIGGVKVLGIERSYAEIEEKEIKFDAEQIADGNWTSILNSLNILISPAKQDNYTELLTLNLNLSADEIQALNFFITYGTKTTRHLGAGERAGVLASYKRAFGYLPTSQSQWQDVIKIARGHWPSAYSQQAEAQAREKFLLIYKRQANEAAQADKSALMLIAYGLRPSKRRVGAEKQAIGIFTHIFKHLPMSAEDWDIVRAIAYSGATR